jgi:hypothetical protein
VVENARVTLNLNVARAGGVAVEETLLPLVSGVGLLDAITDAIAPWLTFSIQLTIVAKESGGFPCPTSSESRGASGSVVHVWMLGHL